MKEITILSGKGGTGKTSVTAAIATLAGKTVFCDNDVDAADLHLIMKPAIREEHTYLGGWTASIDPTACQDCGICSDHCRFDAIRPGLQGIPEIDPYLCEGCRLCERVCPHDAITSMQSSNSKWFVSDTRFGTLVHATMGPGEENSGKLVSEIRKRARELAIEQEAELLINDGPPGIGCAAISSLSGTDLALLVVESTISGLHDLKRLHELILSFSIPAFAILNKYDINPASTAEIESFLESSSIPLLGKIPFDDHMVQAMVRGKTIMEFNRNIEAAVNIRKAWEALTIHLNNREK